MVSVEDHKKHFIYLERSKRIIEGRRDQTKAFILPVSAVKRRPGRRLGE
jgi:hypothetical protein